MPVAARGRFYVCGTGEAVRSGCVAQALHYNRFQYSGLPGRAMVGLRIAPSTPIAICRLHPAGRRCNPTPMSLSTPLRIFALLVLVVSALAARADELTDVQRLQAAGQTDAALKKADEFLATKPKDAAMRFLKGVILTDGKRSAEAIEIFRGLTEDYPELPEPYNNLATLYAAKGDYDAARSALEEALRANPDFAMAHENLGDVYATLANRTYARARQLEPNNTSVPAKLALLRQLLALSQPAAAAAGSAASAAAR